MKGKNYEHTESRETFIKGGFVSIFADTTNKYRLFRFGPFFHKLKLSETEVKEMAVVNPSHKNTLVTPEHEKFVHLESWIQVQPVEREKDHSTEADMEKIYVHILHSQIDRHFFVF